MKILQIIHKPQNRGAETFACQLSNHLIKLGHEVKIVAVHDGNAVLPFKGKIICLHASPQRRFLDFRAWKNLANIIKEFDPDIVQANAGDTLKYAVLSRKIYGWDSALVFRNASAVGRYLNSFFQKKFNSFLYNNVDAVASVSRASKEDIISIFPTLKKRVQIIPIGLEEEKSELSMRLEPKDKKHIVHVGGFTFEKNHSELIEIYKSISKADTDTHLHLIGDGPLRREIEVLVQRTGIQQNVTFHGFVDNPLAYIKAGDVLVLPSIIEGLPGVILEAMYCKTPVVAYDVGGISEVLNNRTGKIIKKGAKDQFALAVVESLKEPNSKIIESAYEVVQNKFKNSVIAERFVAFYHNIFQAAK